MISIIPILLRGKEKKKENVVRSALLETLRVKEGADNKTRAPDRILTAEREAAALRRQQQFDELQAQQARQLAKERENLATISAVVPSAQAVLTSGAKPQPCPTEPRPTSAGPPPVWTAQAVSMLAKAVNKFPGGTRNRWDQIADYVSHQVW